jgi:hypothetical protein
MKRRAEFLIIKRDGRREWLRTTKLARSIHGALSSAGVAEGWLALELATTVLGGLRSRLRAADGPLVWRQAQLSTADVARAVERVLYATGYPLAAVAYAEVRAERCRRSRLLGDLRRDRLPSAPATPTSSRSGASIDRN